MHITSVLHLGKGRVSYIYGALRNCTYNEFMQVCIFPHDLHKASKPRHAHSISCHSSSDSFRLLVSIQVLLNDPELDLF
jgi:hypothetical protein